MFKNKAKIAVTVGLLIVLSLVIPSMDSKAQTEDENTITLTFGGDVTFGYKNESGHKGSMPHFLEENGMDYSIIFRNVYDIFSNDDLTVVNLETTITDTTSHMDKTYYFRAPYEYVDILKEGSIEAVSIANNHANDYFAQGRTNTVRTLAKNDILVTGENYAASVEIKGIKIAILGYVTFQTGFNYKSAIKRDIPYMAKSHDIVIVMMHWGQELHYEANRGDINLAHEMVDLGADLVIGHHPHVIQGIENYNGRYIAYSLGNCSFAGSSNPTNDDILLFQQKFVKTEYGVEPAEAKVIPCRVSSQKNVNDFQPTPFEGEEVTRVLNRVLDFSSHMEYGLLNLTADWMDKPYTRYDQKIEENQSSD